MRFLYDEFKKIDRIDIYLCNPDGKVLFPLTCVSPQVVLRFNSLSEFTFDIHPRTRGVLDDEITFDSYDYITTGRLVYVSRVGWFSITEVTEHDNGNAKYKSVSTKSYEITLNNKGVYTEERVYCFYNPNDPYDANYDANDASAIPSVVGQLYRQLGVEYGNRTDVDPGAINFSDWTISYINPSLVYDGVTANCRSLKENTANGYDWIVNDVCSAFEIVALFDFLNKKIEFKTVSEVTKMSGLVLSFRNFMQNIEVTESSDDIVTVMNVKGENCDISSVNPIGTGYICDFSYYMDEENKRWMSDDLIEKLKAWDNDINSRKADYEALVTELRELYLQKSQINEPLVEVRTRSNDLNTAFCQYAQLAASGETPAGLTAVESVNNGGTSLDRRSKYYHASQTPQVFDTNSVQIEAYNEEPQYIDGGFVFSNTAKSITGTPDKICNENVMFSNRAVVTYTKGMSNPSVTITLDKTMSGDKTFDLVKKTTWNLLSPLQITVPANEKSVTIQLTLAGGENLDSIVFAQSDSYQITFDTSLNVTDADPDQYLYFVDGANSSFASYSFCKLKMKAVKKTKGACTFESLPAPSPSNVNCVYLVTDAFRTDERFIEGENIQKDPGTPVCIIEQEDGVYKYSTSEADIVVYKCDGFTRYINFGGIHGGTPDIKTWFNTQERQARNLQLDLNDVDYQIDNKIAEIQSISNALNVASYFSDTPILLKELYKYWREGEYTNENISILETTTQDEELSLVKELYDAGKIELGKVNQPRYTFTVSSVDFIHSYDLREQAEKLILGSTVSIEREDGVWYQPALLELAFGIEQDGSAGGDFSMTFANSLKLDDWGYTYADLISNASNTSRQVNANWSNITKYSREKKDIIPMIQNPLSATLRAGLESSVNQEFQIDEHGILGRKRKDAIGELDDDEYDGEQFRMINNQLLFTDDGWKTIKTALGKIYYNSPSDGSPTAAYGIIGETIIGSLLIGEELVIKNNKDDDQSSIIINQDGISIKRLADGSNVDVFKASTDGELYVRGEIDAESLRGNVFRGRSKTTSIFLDSVVNSGNKVSAYVYIYNYNRLRIQIDKFLSEDKDFDIGLKLTNRDTKFLSITIPHNSLTADMDISWMANIESVYFVNSGENTYEFFDHIDNNLIAGSVREDGIFGTSNPVFFVNTRSSVLNDTTLIIQCRTSPPWNRTLYATIELTAGSNSFAQTISLSISEEISYVSIVPTKNIIVNSDNRMLFTIVSEGQDIQEHDAVGVKCKGTFAPYEDASMNTGYNLGSPDFKWKDIYLYSGVIDTSSRQNKTSIEDLDSSKIDQFFSLLRPRKYILKNGESGRYHYGFVLDEIGTALADSGMSSSECAAYCLDNQSMPDGEGGIRYDEFIALNTLQIQKLLARIETLEAKLREYESQK